MRWTFDDTYPGLVFQHPEPGKVDLLRTIPLFDSAANAGTPVPKTWLDHEGRSLRANSWSSASDDLGHKAISHK